jgi:hypothetical protein
MAGKKVVYVADSTGENGGFEVYVLEGDAFADLKDAIRNGRAKLNGDTGETMPFECDMKKIQTYLADQACADPDFKPQGMSPIYENGSYRVFSHTYGAGKRGAVVSGLKDFLERNRKI